MKFLRPWLLALLFSLASLCAQPLKLPASSIGLDSAAGQQLLLESSDRSDYWPLSLHFETQATPAQCGAASAVMVLNSLAIARPPNATHPPFLEFTQDNFFSALAESVLSRQKLNQQGATLDELGGMLASWNLDVQVHHAAPGGLDDFRTQARAALASGTQFVIINFHRDPLEQVGGSHFSPLAAYHQGSDRFLVLDVARFRYPPYWITAERLFAAMQTVDGVSQQTRGYLLIQAHK